MTGTSVKYDKTFTIGKTTVHVVSPPLMSQDEVSQIMNGYYSAAWSIIEELWQKEEAGNVVQQAVSG